MFLQRHKTDPKRINRIANSTSADDLCEVCEVWFHFQTDDDEPRSLVSLWKDIRPTDRYTRWVRICEDARVVRTNNLRESSIFRAMKDDAALVRVPPILRA